MADSFIESLRPSCGQSRQPDLSLICIVRFGRHSHHMQTATTSQETERKPAITDSLRLAPPFHTTCQRLFVSATNAHAHTHKAVQHGVLGALHHTNDQVRGLASRVFCLDTRRHVPVTLPRVRLPQHPRSFQHDEPFLTPRPHHCRHGYASLRGFRRRQEGVQEAQVLGSGPSRAQDQLAAQETSQD